jgi:multidrug efflux pump subunit AcrA (membrane-fusion protein)
MSVGVAITAKTIQDAIAVPSSAVFKNVDGAYYLLVAGTDKKAHQKIVQLGVRNPELTQITNGINTGDSVIVSGGYAVPDGTAIEIEKSSDNEKDGEEQPSAQPEKDKD